jgi:Trk K+ transport system NAD-binding subunit
VDDLQRQLRFALVAFLIIIPLGVVGFMYFEGISFVEALYVTIITLSTIGYGDITPATDAGRLFVVGFVISGLSVFAFAGQAFLQVLTSPALRIVRQRRQTQRQIAELESHYIICGMGEMVDKTIEYLLQGANARRHSVRATYYQPVDDFLDKIFGDDAHGHHLWLRRPLQRFFHWLIDMSRSQTTLLDIVVVVTQDKPYAERLRNKGLLVVEGNPSEDATLHEAGIQRAQAMMVLLDSDTEALIAVLTAHTLVPTLHITAAVLDDDLSRKIIRAGSAAVLTPFEIAGQFLNNATFRPAVNDFYNGLLFEHSTNYRMTQLLMGEDSPWIGREIGKLKLREQYDAGIIGIRYANKGFNNAPALDYVLEEDDVLLAVAPSNTIDALQKDVRGGKATTRLRLWQALPFLNEPIKGEHSYSLMEAEKAVSEMEKHFIIAGNDRLARNAIDQLDPSRPFVIISSDNTLTSELLKRGFRVLHGNPTSEDILIKAGIKKAQAIMVALEKKSDSVLTVLSSRALNKKLLITASANTDDMVEKLERAGADRVLSPFHVAARFVLLTTTRPELSGFVNAVIYNRQTGLETTEIYMEDNSLWIGKTIADLHLQDYEAGVVGVRQADRKHFVYAPPSDYLIKAHEVLIIVTPMNYSDEIRDSAYGGSSRRPNTLRSNALQSNRWTPDEIQKILKQARKS